MSENDGQFELWLEDTSATSAMFSGIGGNTYAFYSMATDNVGLREQTPTGPDTFTTALPNSLPSAPSLYSPAHMSKVATASPPLSVQNSLDTDEDTLTYEYEIYPNIDLTSPAHDSVNVVPEGDANTSWTSGIALNEDTWYSWRARSFDGLDYSEWMPGPSF